MPAPAKPVVDIDLLTSHLNKEWGAESCQMCHKGEWAVGDTIFEMREFYGGGLVVGPGPVLPVLPVTCSNCGYTVLINAIVVGQVKKDSGGKSNG